MSIRTNMLSNSNIFVGSKVRPVGSVAMLKTFFGIWRERQTLRKLDDHLLKDIGYSRKDAEIEANRPSWDAPERWMR